MLRRAALSLLPLLFWAPETHSSEDSSNIELSRKKTVCLNMIVKNESEIIERCLASVKPMIDYWVIVDTGSSDQTQQIIQTVMRDIPGELHEAKWVNFEHNRNEALNLARDKSDYLLFIDADEILTFSESFIKPKLDKDYYISTVQQANGLSYQRILLINSHLHWQWHGVLHEVVTSPQAKTFELLLGVVNFSNTADGARSKDPKKYHHDAQILEDALSKDPTNSRYTFYLAQSYANAQEYSLALKNYTKRAAMGGDNAEIFWSLYCIPRLQKLLNEPVETVVKNFWNAFQYQPLRAEPLFELINYYLANHNYPLAYILSKHACSISIPNDMIFVDQRIYDYGLLIQLADTAYLMGMYEESSQAIAQLLANPRLPQQERIRLEQNASAFSPSLK